MAKLNTRQGMSLSGRRRKMHATYLDPDGLGAEVNALAAAQGWTLSRTIEALVVDGLACRAQHRHAEDAA